MRNFKVQLSKPGERPVDVQADYFTVDAQAVALFYKKAGAEGGHQLVASFASWLLVMEASEDKNKNTVTVPSGGHVTA